ncbi:hypothetical protein D7I46_08700 [Lactococcus allomyrinae]|uniref:DNA/RNA non-specific endonuclease/pyrophosphatase/phosphodiesterase domain-containing protein n=1 Tax=Lactococcus allomyrinae TaxID=2419773 RepID=A0A387BDM3_9LACT|nr:hypothetical protein D7I46_08700 [Lactococcus allomyrinae]
MDKQNVTQKVDQKVQSIKLPGIKLPGTKQAADRSADKDILPFEKKKELVLGKLDILGRATYAHIQLKNSDEPTEKREAQLTYDPSGWHNYKLPYEKGKSAWVMNRGHLVGYQFSGLNDEPKNLITETAWVNQGNYDSMNDSNDKAMLYYENRLDHWLARNPNEYLDYKVTPIYQGSELVARQIKLDYVGLDSQGKLIQIKLGSPFEKTVNSVTEVVLENTAPNLLIDYQTGEVKAK